jgi:hypothetical protein
MIVYNKTLNVVRILCRTDFTLTFEEQRMTLTKAQIVEALFAENIFTKAQSAQIIDTLFELIK